MRVEVTHKVNSSSNRKIRNWTAVKKGNTFLGIKSPRTAHIPKEDIDGRVKEGASCVFQSHLCRPMKIFNSYVKPILLLGCRT